jgi:hypothetical protein
MKTRPKRLAPAMCAILFLAVVLWPLALAPPA